MLGLQADVGDLFGGASSAAGAAASSVGGGGFGSFAGAGLSMLGGYIGNQASARQARYQRDWEERMSGTAHQREVKDLQAAGLNPILSGMGGSGSSTPSGASAQQQDIMTPAVRTWQDQRMQDETFKNMSLQRENIDADTSKKRDEGFAARASGQDSLASARLKGLTSDNYSEEVMSRIAQNRASTRNLDERSRTEGTVRILNSELAKLRESERTGQGIKNQGDQLALVVKELLQRGEIDRAKLSSDPEWGGFMRRYGIYSEAGGSAKNALIGKGIFSARDASRKSSDPGAVDAEVRRYRHFSDDIPSEQLQFLQ
ncbi:MAG: DNA pilot protein [Microvirus sp.]|nr:MAG: DNA pilot protein [Microvirus sp.]